MFNFLFHLICHIQIYLPLYVCPFASQRPSQSACLYHRRIFTYIRLSWKISELSWKISELVLKKYRLVLFKFGRHPFRTSAIPAPLTQHESLCPEGRSVANATPSEFHPRCLPAVVILENKTKSQRRKVLDNCHVVSVKNCVVLREM